jgi:hypothetical protein
MMRALRSLVAGLLCAALAATAFAAPMTNDEYQGKLKAYDPAAVEAATNYAKSFDMVGGFAKNAPKMAEGMTKALKEKNPGITDDQVKDFVETFEHVALVDNADVINHAVVLALLESFSAEEIIALDKFYSTPVGQGILKKFPTVTQKLGEARRLMPTEIMPKAMEAAKAKLKADGLDVKL